MVSRLVPYRLERIAAKPPGRLEQPFVRVALARGLRVVVLTPLKIRRFAGAIGQLAKTDEIDARLIAQFGAAIKPSARPVSDAKAQTIKHLVVHRRQIATFRTMEKNRRQVMLKDRGVSIDHVIAALNPEIARLDEIIDRTVEKSTVWCHKRDLLMSLPGIGKTVGDMPELGSLNRREIASRLLQVGKHKKVALTACIRKIIITLNAMIRDNLPWKPAMA